MEKELITISLTNKCNLECEYCVMKEFRNKPMKNGEQQITLDEVIAFVSKFPNAYIELTGGEPTLFKGIENLLDWLENNNRSVLIRSNGLIPIRQRRGLVRCVTRHKPELVKSEAEAFINLPFETPFDGSYGKPAREGKFEVFRQAFICPSGEIRICPLDRSSRNIRTFNEALPMGCTECSLTISALKLLNAE